MLKRMYVIFFFILLSFLKKGEEYGILRRTLQTDSNSETPFKQIKSGQRTYTVSSFWVCVGGLMAEYEEDRPWVHRFSSQCECDWISQIVKWKAMQSYLFRLLKVYIVLASVSSRLWMNVCLNYIVAFSGSLCVQCYLNKHLMTVQRYAYSMVRTVFWR